MSFTGFRCGATVDVVASAAWSEGFGGEGAAVIAETVVAGRCGLWCFSRCFTARVVVLVEVAGVGRCGRGEKFIWRQRFRS